MATAETRLNSGSAPADGYVEATEAFLDIAGSPFSENNNKIGLSTAPSRLSVSAAYHHALCA